MKSRRTIEALLLSLTVLVGGACKKEQAAPKPVPLRPAELQQRTESAHERLEALKPELATLRSKFTALHREFDPLPPGLPDFGETRARFYSTDIGLGTLSAKLPWLQGRIDAARASADGDELARVSVETTRMQEELRQVDRIALELSRDVQPFKRATEEKLGLQALGKNTCE